MNDYVEVRLDVEPCSETVTDLLAALLAECGFESFVPDSSGLTAYVPKALHTPGCVAACVAQLPMEDVSVRISETDVEGRDWNAEWEKNYFKPIVIAGRCVIHSSFHTDIPAAEYDIVIDPKMAFGTGHHTTTSLIVSALLDMNLDGLDVIDMGTGTAILAILAAMRGARRVAGIEIDPFAAVNARENLALNKV
ncbi:MAG: 50S ribosomal protein L11 methyltransferase, partial [Paramuribaculum sp.]|nr:50S ribosomal protein L11 methyltransferase [Paramuribaculum sp.]